VSLPRWTVERLCRSPELVAQARAVSATRLQPNTCYGYNMIAVVHPALKSFQKQTIDGCRVQLIQEGDSDIFQVLLVDDLDPSNELPLRTRSLEIVIPRDAADSDFAWDVYAYQRCKEIAEQIPRAGL
jgi:hypothetical protein